MKTHFPIAAAILFSGLMLSSCKKNEEATDTAVTDSTAVMTDTASAMKPDTTATAPASDTTASAASGATTSMNTTGHNESAGAVSRKASQAKTSGKEKKDLKGYGAPNGTDAENHDGDQYTKNNNKAMPSGGTSIK